MVELTEQEVVTALYDAALGTCTWSDTAQKMTAAMGGSTLTMFIHEPLTNIADVVALQNIPDDALKAYTAHFSKHDVWVLSALNKRLFERPFANPELIDDRSFQRSEFYNDFLRRNVNMYHAAGALTSLGGGRMGMIGIHRPREHSEFTNDDLGRLGRLLGHIRGSLLLHQRIRTAEATAASALAALDRLSAGVILLGSTGNLLHANRAADSILHANDGLAFGRDGLHAAISDEDKRLQGLIAGAKATTLNSADKQTAGGRVRVSRPSGRRAYAVVITPAGRGLAPRNSERAAALVFINDPALHPVVDVDALQVQFGLPAAEARLAIALVSGLSLPRYAERTGISYHTARTLLARALARTGTESQLGLVRLILTSIVGIAKGLPGKRDPER